MFLIREPSEDMVRKYLASQRDQPYSYKEVGATRDKAPAGYNLDHNRIEIGKGIEAFDYAVRAVRSWKMFQMDWVKLCWPGTAIETGEIVGILVRHYSFWSLNATRIVYVLDEEGPVRKYGFAYGTLRDHAESGEERFSVEHRKDDDSVWYDLFAFSRPNQFLAKAASPLARRLQKRFAADSKSAMSKAVRHLQSK